MNKKQLLQGMASATQLSERNCKLALESAINIITNIMKEGEEDININNFISFKVKVLPAKKSRNPRTGESINVPSRKRVRVKVSNKLSKIIQ